MNELPKRKNPRLKNYDYSKPGAYFITVCTKNKECILGDIVGTGVPDCPEMVLSTFGEIADKYLNQLNDFYNNISIDKYVIMPNHIHLLISISDCGQSRTLVPTNCNTKNSVIPQFISTFKRFCNKEYGLNIWQYRYHDHIIRTDTDYKKIWEYINTNVIKWHLDCFYTKVI